ncbi:large ribosomal subunit protein bL17m-like [Liolophura sinensis]|uniref:large ribosomal subunit protein bL17m-like n=1 Tax=Liolophura sinensis TaxID=3198878 RepID=UPI003159216C
MLRYRYKPRHRRLSSALGPCSGPHGRIKSLQKTVTQLFRTERIEANYGRCDEARGYAERLIQEAIKHGDKHPGTMEMADYWLLEKDLIHKLFKVFVPRYQQYSSSFTRVWNLPVDYPGDGIQRAILELKGNPWPSVIPAQREKSSFLSNVLLAEARKEFRKYQYADQAGRMVEGIKGSNSASVVDTGEGNSAPLTPHPDKISQTADSLITDTSHLSMTEDTKEEGVK